MILGGKGALVKNAHERQNLEISIEDWSLRRIREYFMIFIIYLYGGDPIWKSLRQFGPGTQFQISEIIRTVIFPTLNFS